MSLSLLIRSKKGTSIVLFSAALVAIIGFASIVIDIGLAFNEKAVLVNATDAAALAGAQELVYNKSNAQNVAKDYLQKNGVGIDNAEIKIAGDGKSINVKSNKTVDYFFARVIGITRGEAVHAGSGAT